MKERAEKERGQSLVEMAVITPFLLILLLAMVELSQAFVAYIGVINGAREGAVYAALNPEIRNCSNPPEMDTSSISALCKLYSERVKAETVALNLDTDFLTVNRPVAPNPRVNCPITVTISYQLITFTSSASLPLFGRMGLPSAYIINYSTSMPIREGDEFCTY